MMGLATIRQFQREAARKARRNKAVPVIVEAEDIADAQAGNTAAIHIPNLGDHRPKGYKLVDTLFVDKTGFGSEREPALTINGMFRRMKAGYAYAMIEEGQFQCYVGEFEVL